MAVIHYHGTPVGGNSNEAAKFLQGRHSLVSHANPGDMAIVADVCQSFALDNGAFTEWRKGRQIDVADYMDWVSQWARHPGFDWALIPDVIDGDEHENDELLRVWDASPVAKYGVPVWHLHESLNRLQALCQRYRTVALGSSGAYRTPGTAQWWGRMSQAMSSACDEHGRPVARLHGLRMLDPNIFTRLPLASADSTNAVVNAGSLGRFGIYKPPSRAQRAEVIAARIEQHNSAPIWFGTVQHEFLLEA